MYEDDALSELIVSSTATVTYNCVLCRQSQLGLVTGLLRRLVIFFQKKRSVYCHMSLVFKS